MYLTENKIVYLPNIKEEKMDYEKIVQDLDLPENVYGSVPLNEGRKRMRLHQLSWEEKIQRKKLRNRIAAQTSRDRKKAKMDQLEESVKELKRQNELLLFELRELKKKNEMLINANGELQKALAERPYTCSCLRKIREEAEEQILDLHNDVEEQICVEDGYSFERPAESSEIPQQKGRLLTSAQISGIGQQKCTYNTEVVGETPKKLESSRSKINMKLRSQQNCFQFTEPATRAKIYFISLEHSYASPEGSSSLPEGSKINSNGFDFNIPTITVADSDKTYAVENEMKKDTEPDMLNSKDSLNIFTFLNLPSPKSEASSDQGYESGDSPYKSEISEMDAFDDFNELWRDTFSELFPELL